MMIMMTMMMIIIIVTIDYKFEAIVGYYLESDNVKFSL
jgi:hypothetical protein